MKPATETLGAIIECALQTHGTLSAEEITAALNILSRALETAHLYGNPKDIVADLRHTSNVLSCLLYVISSNVLHVQGNTNRSLIKHICSLHRKVNHCLNEYVDAGVYRYRFLPVKTLSRTLVNIDRALKENTGIAEIYSFLQPGIQAAIISAKTMHYPRWLWWSQFVGTCEPSIQTLVSFRDLLVELNFNTASFFNWLCFNVMQEIESAATPSQKSGMFLNAIAKYERCKVASYGYLPAEKPVRQAIVIFLKRELFCFIKTFPAEQPPSKTGMLKLNTVLSVPQLALLVRLMVETKILNEGNQSALLKSIAAVLSTSKAAAISSESLRVNYYTPSMASKTIVKEYLLQMIRLVNSY
jgi:hypothetical protein